MTQDQHNDETYQAPKVEEIGSVEDITLGGPGNSYDGTGRGNRGQGGGPMDQGSR